MDFMQNSPDYVQNRSKLELSSGFQFPCLLRWLSGLSKVLLRELEQQGSGLFTVASNIASVPLCFALFLFSSASSQCFTLSSLAVELEIIIPRR